MKEDERDWIKNNKEICEACGHLVIFHNFHCCEFCMVEGCSCEWGELDEEPEK